MQDEALAALAASGGAAVATVPGTGDWPALRDGLARWFGRGVERREAVVLERLDQAGAELVAAPLAQRETLRSTCRAIWQARIQDLLEDFDDEDERAGAADALGTLLARLPAPRPQVGAGPGGIAVGGDLTVRAEGERSVAAGLVHGDVHIGHPLPGGGAGSPDRPLPPDASQG